MIDAARLAAFRALREVTGRQAYVHLAAKRHLGGLSDLDRRFAHELLMGTLERLVALDWTLNRFISSKRVHAAVRDCLRMGTYQILFLDRVPDAAACSATVELMRAAGKGALAGFANGVMRAVARDGKNLSPPGRLENLPAHLSVRYSVPQWLAELWLREMGPEETEALLACRPADSVIYRVNPFIAGDLDLSIEETVTLPGGLVPEALRAKGGELLRSGLFTAGRVTVQGEASQWLVKAAAYGDPRDVWDVCAAPGGKTAALAAALGGRARILATDVHPLRVALINRTLERLDVPGVTVSLHDATRPLGEDTDFDLVMVDAPCSGLGTYKNHPDVLLKASPERIAAVAGLQRLILESACGHVRPGGILLYSTCTLTRAENEDQVAGFLERHPQFTLEGIPNLPGGRLGDGMARLTPHRDGTEGFFAARMRKAEAPWPAL